MIANGTAGFEHKRLKYVVSLRRSRSDSAGDDRRFLGLEHVQSGTGRLTAGNGGPYAEQPSGSVESLSGTFEPDDVLFGKLRPYLAKAWLADFPGRCTTEFLVLTPIEIEGRFLRYVFLWNSFIDAVDASTFGSKMPRADWDFIGNMPVPLPNRMAQAGIADYLDRETARLDALIEAKERLSGLLAEKRQALITRAVTRGLEANAPLRDSGIPWLGPIPAHWKTVALRFLVDIMSGATPDTGKSEYWDGEIPWVSPKDMKRDEIADSEDHVTQVAVAESALRPIQKGAVLIVVRGMILAHSFPVAITTGDVTINQDMKAMLCRHGLHPAFLRDYFRGINRHVVSLADSSAHGTRKLESEVLGQLPICLPPFDEQVRISEVIRGRTIAIDRSSSLMSHTIAVLKERRAALIAAAVTGQIPIPSESLP